MNTINLAHILRGCEAGDIQTVGNMQIIPLINTDYQDNRFISPVRVRVGTHSYGTMVFKNPFDQVAIVPAGTTYIVDKKAQNHAMTYTGVVKGQQTTRFEGAACVQRSQGGQIPSGEYPLRFLPLPIKQAGFDTRHAREFGKLWESIAKFNRQFNISDTGHIHIFFDRFSEQMAHFSAEFEPVENQVGAIVIINGNVVGVERAPNNQYWLSIWEALIRECYGAYAMAVAKNSPPATRIPMAAPATGYQSFEDVFAAYDQAVAEEAEATKGVVRELMSTQLIVNDRDSDQSGLVIISVSGGGQDDFKGQVLESDNTPVYASILATKASTVMNRMPAFKI